MRPAVFCRPLTGYILNQILINVFFIALIMLILSFRILFFIIISLSVKIYGLRRNNPRGTRPDYVNKCLSLVQSGAYHKKILHE